MRHPHTASVLTDSPSSACFFGSRTHFISVLSSVKLVAATVPILSDVSPPPPAPGTLSSIRYVDWKKKKNTHSTVRVGGAGVGVQ